MSLGCIIDVYIRVCPGVVLQPSQFIYGVVKNASLRHQRPEPPWWQIAQRYLLRGSQPYRRWDSPEVYKHHSFAVIWYATEVFCSNKWLMRYPHISLIACITGYIISIHHFKYSKHSAMSLSSSSATWSVLICSIGICRAEIMVLLQSSIICISSRLGKETFIMMSALNTFTLCWHVISKLRHFYNLHHKI